MITDPTVRAAKQKQLNEARDAYHSLVTGTQARVMVDQNGERIEFTAANKQYLYSYIVQLESILGCDTQSFRPSGPAGFFF